MDDIWLFLFPL